MTESAFYELQAIFEEADKFNEARAEELIGSLKLALLGVNSVVLAGGDVEAIAAQKMLRGVLEYDALLSIYQRRIDAFERVMEQLKCFYFKLTYLPPSEKMPLLVAINLVHCLTLNNLVDFNIEMELAKSSVAGDDKFIRYAYELHRSIIDNSFSRLCELESDPPSMMFSQFTKDLLRGARERYADAIERSYHSLTFADLEKILRFTGVDECRIFVRNRNWRSVNEMIYFNPQMDDKAKSSSEMLARSVDLSVQISALA